MAEKQTQPGRTVKLTVLTLWVILVSCGLFAFDRYLFSIPNWASPVLGCLVGWCFLWLVRTWTGRPLYTATIKDLFARRG